MLQNEDGRMDLLFYLNLAEETFSTLIKYFVGVKYN